MEMSRRDFMIAASSMAGTQLETDSLKSARMKAPKPKAGQKSVAGYAAAPLDRVRCAFIGVGARGSGHVEQVMQMDGVEIIAICDTHEPSRMAAIKGVEAKGRPAPASYGAGGDWDYRKMLERDDIDAVFIATPWEFHVPMSVDTLNSGKHAFVEVPMAISVEGCWQIVDAAERNQRHAMMMENVCYGREELLVLNMCRMGVFGELLHAEGAYIHDLRWQMNEVGHGTGSWRTLHYAKRNGNLYPTHGLGPVAQYLNINRGDRFDYLSSVSSPSMARELFKPQLKAGNPHAKLNFVCGDLNTSIIKTVRGRSLVVQWDEQLPRPYNRLNLVQGTKGIWGGFPNRCVIEGETPSTESWVQGAELDKLMKKYEHPLWGRMGEVAKKAGGHGGMDFIMLWRIIYCLRNGLPMDQDVYDGAAWSVVGPLSEWSVKNRSQSIDVPDFTRGEWRSMKPLDVIR